MSGWIKLHRRIQDHWTWQEKEFSKFQAWIDLLLMARWKDTPKTMVDKKGTYVLNYGDILACQRFLAERWGWSTKKVRRFLDLCHDDGQIEYPEKNHKRTVIRIVNMRLYQDQGTTEEPEKNRKGTAKEPKKKKERRVRREEGKNIVQTLPSSNSPFIFGRK